jgi:hypothetical protein
MMMLGGWRIERGAPCPAEVDPISEVLRWRDPACALSVSQLGPPRDDNYRLRLGSDLAVDILANERIVTRPSENFSQATVDHVLADLVYPRLLARAGSFVIHAGAVRVGESALMLMGLSGRGKSTLATSFDRAGFALLGDDAMIVSSLDTRPRVRPVYPSLRLLPDSVEAILPEAVTSSVASYTSKRRIDVTAADQSDWPLPIAAIFSIAAPAADGLIDIRRLTIAETCMCLIESSFAFDPSDAARARDRMADASILAGQVPAFEITYPRDYARLSEVRQAIIDCAATSGLK